MNGNAEITKYFADGDSSLVNFDLRKLEKIQSHFHGVFLMK